MSQNWRGGGPKFRFGDERKPIVDRPPIIHDGAYDDFCWCGEQHEKPEGKEDYWRAGVHPWPYLDAANLYERLLSDLAAKIEAAGREPALDAQVEFEWSDDYKVTATIMTVPKGTDE